MKHKYTEITTIAYKLSWNVNKATVNHNVLQIFIHYRYTMKTSCSINWKIKYVMGYELSYLINLYVYKLYISKMYRESRNYFDKTLIILYVPTGRYR